MTRLIKHAAKSMPDETFLPIDPPSGAGLVLLAEPIEYNYDILAWFGFDSYCRISLLSSAHPTFLTTNKVPFGATADQVVDQKPESPDARSIFNEMIRKAAEKLPRRSGEAPKPRKPWPTRALDIAEIKRISRLRARHSTRFNQMLFPKAFWAIIEQTLVRIVTGRGDRASRRRLEKAGQPIPAVKYVMLRKIRRSTGDGAADINWSHRWMVEGHWRNQWHPRHQIHRQKYILPYVKGPDDKPLVLKDALNLVVR
jgi:hypothetical protein